jgi:hypothetical protein
MQSVVDVDSGLIIHHDVVNEANDSQLLHPMSTATMRVLEVDELKILADGGYSNAQAVAQCERDNVEVAAPIKRGAMSTDFFRPTQFTYDASSDTIRCPAGDTRDRFFKELRHVSLHDGARQEINSRRDP